MGLYRRGRTWWLNYVDSLGKQHRETSGSTNKRTAEQLLSIRKAQVLESRLPLPRARSPRLDEWSDRFLQSIHHPKTRERYGASVKNLLGFFGPVRLCDITPEAIYEFQQHRIGMGVKAATCNRDRAVLSRQLNLAKKQRLIAANPCADVDALNECSERRQAKPLTYEEEAALMSVSGPWLRVLITLLVSTGLRPKKEALTLKWVDIDLDSDSPCILVRQSKTRAGVRRVWLTQYCKEALLDWRKVLGSEFSEYLFPSPRNPNLHITEYQSPWHAATHAAGLSDRRVYDLRATFASRGNECHATALTLAHALGHASTGILPTYVKPADENMRALISALDVHRTAHKSTSTIQ